MAVADNSASQAHVVPKARLRRDVRARRLRAHIERECANAASAAKAKLPEAAPGA